MNSFPFPDTPPEKQYLGKYKAYVRDNVDPQNRGRLRVYCPQVMGTQDDTNHWTGWAEANFPWMGGINTLDFGSPLTKQQQLDAYGSEYVGVWLEFEGGNPDFPVWTGTWLIAPTPTDTNAQQNLGSASGMPGGDIVNNPPNGSTLSDLNPPQPQVPTTETRIMVKEGREIVIGCVNGGYIILNAYGVQLVGVQVMANGREFIASIANGVVK